MKYQIDKTKKIIARIVVKYDNSLPKISCLITSADNTIPTINLAQLPRDIYSTFQYIIIP